MNNVYRHHKQDGLKFLDDLKTLHINWPLLKPKLKISLNIHLSYPQYLNLAAFHYWNSNKWPLMCSSCHRSTNTLNLSPLTFFTWNDNYCTSLTSNPAAVWRGDSISWSFAECTSSALSKMIYATCSANKFHLNSFKSIYVEYLLQISSMELI